MNAASQKCNQPTLWDMPSTTSSPESVAGALPCVSQGGLPIGESGQAPAPASRSVQRGSGKAKKTKDTSGQSGLSCSEGTTLSASESLSLSLVNRLRQRLGTAGSMEYAQTWKQKVTPAGMRYWEHTALGHRTSGSDYTGWPTTVSNPANGTPEDFLRRKRESVARGNQMGISLSDLNMVSQLTGWVSPVAGWQSPVAGDAKGVAYRRDGGQKGKERLSNLGLVAGWVSPSCRDWKDTAGMSETGTNPDGSLRVRLDQLPRQSQLTSGQTTTSSPAGTGKRGVLNPEFVAWLMGYRGEWLSCVDWETLSSRKRQRSSSKRS